MLEVNAGIWSKQSLSLICSVLLCVCAKWVKKYPPAAGVQSNSVCNIFTAMAVTSVWSDVWCCRCITPYAVVCSSLQFLMLCAVFTKNRAGLCNTSNLRSATDITVLVLVVQLTVQMAVLTPVCCIQTVVEEQQLWLYVVLLNQYSRCHATESTDRAVVCKD